METRGPEGEENHVSQPAPEFAEPGPVRPTAQLDDLSLLQRLRDGDDAALSVLHERHVQTVYWVARERVGSIPDAEEIAQDAFVLLWRKCRRVEIVGESCLPWLLATVNYLALNMRKTRERQARHVTVMPNDIEARVEVEEAAIRALEMRRVERVLVGLSAIDQEVYRLCLVEGLSYKQAASRLSTSHAAVRNRLARVRSILRREVGR